MDVTAEYICCRCVAENSAGRSEVTFKAWFSRASDDRRRTGFISDEVDNHGTGTTSEVFVGALVGSLVVVTVAVALCVICAIRGRPLCHHKYAYYVRDSHVNGKTKSSSTLVAPSWVQRLVVRGRRLFSGASAVEHQTAGEDAIGGGLDVVDDDDDDDKFICSTLQSLLEAKQLFDESLPRANPHHEETEKSRVENEELLQTEVIDRTEESDVDRCANHDDSASKTDSEQTGHEAPDLLTGDGHTFRRGGVARSPYRRSKQKVSFADCRSPSSQFTSDDSTPSQMSSTPYRQVVAADDGSSTLRGASRHSFVIVDLSDSSSKNNASRTRVKSVHRSHSSNAVTQRHRQSCRHEPDTDSFDIALPATISGVTEGLFPPTKPVRTYEWTTSRECSRQLGPRFSEPAVRYPIHNIPSHSHGTEV